MDPLSSVASVIAVIQLSTEVVQYIVNVAGYSKERRRLREEVLACESVLLSLQDNADDPHQGENWGEKIQTLGQSPDSPLHRLSVILNVVKTKLKPKTGREKVKAALRWPFDEKELQMLVEAIENEKSLLQLALTYENRSLIKAIKSNASENQKLLLKLSDMIEEKSTSLQNDIQELRRHKMDAEQQAILNWLSPTDYAPIQSDLLSRRQDGTGQWLLDSTEFQDWLHNKNQTLFCPGIPGAGKTILTSIVIGKLHERFHHDENIGIAYLYCNFQRKNEQEVRNLLANVLKQLTQSLAIVPESLKSLHGRLSSRGSPPTTEDISKILPSVVALLTRTFILVDALDECDLTPNNARELLTFLFSLQKSCGLNIFATSRFIPELVERFNFDGCRSLEIRASDEDVRKYLRGHMSQLPGFVEKKPSLQEAIVEDITNFTDGMFLLAQISLSSLEDKTTPKAMKSALEQLRKDSSSSQRKEKTTLLGRAYEQAMQRIQSQRDGFKTLAEQVLSWIVCAKRQLTIEELQHALATEPDELELDPDNLPEEEDMALVCAGLVTIDEQTGIIRLVHYTLQEYFQSTWSTWFPGANTAITKICVTYLSFHAFESGMCSTSEELDGRLRMYPLYSYAAIHWGYHAYEDCKETEELIIKFLRKQGNVIAANQGRQTYSIHLKEKNSLRPPRQTNGLHLAARFGLKDALFHLLKDGLDPNSKDSGGITPLLWAASQGSPATVQLLLATEGVDPYIKSDHGLTAFHCAVAVNKEESVEIFLADGRFELNSRTMDGHTPLFAAATCGNSYIVKRLLSFKEIDREIKASELENSCFFVPRDRPEKLKYLKELLIPIEDT